MLIQFNYIILYINFIRIIIFCFVCFQLPHELSYFTTGTDSQLKLNLLALLHRDSELSLQTSMLQSACHLEDVDVASFDVSSVIG